MNIASTRGFEPLQALTQSQVAAPEECEGCPPHGTGGCSGTALALPHCSQPKLKNMLLRLKPCSARVRRENCRIQSLVRPGRTATLRPRRPIAEPATDAGSDRRGLRQKGVLQRGAVGDRRLRRREDPGVVEVVQTTPRRRCPARPDAQPPVRGPSSTARTRFVRATDSSTVSRSSGRSVRRSTTSTSMPSPASPSAASSASAHALADRDECEVAAGASDARLPDRDHLLLGGGRRPFD